MWPGLPSDEGDLSTRGKEEGIPNFVAREKAISA